MVKKHVPRCTCAHCAAARRERVRKRSRPRLHGLLHGPRRVQVEDVKKAHKKPCCICDQVPTTRRLFVVDGSGRNATSRVYCMDHGVEYLKALKQETDNAGKFLLFGTVDRSTSVFVGVRMPWLYPIPLPLKPKKPKEED